MTMNLLEQIAGSRLPLTFYRTEDIDQLRVLRAAGLVVALLPPPHDSPSRVPAPAQVLAVTQKGLEELARIHYPESPPPRWRFRMPRIKTAAWPRLLGKTGEARKPARLQ
jgi:hypothetical protein